MKTLFVFCDFPGLSLGGGGRLLVSPEQSVSVLQLKFALWRTGNEPPLLWFDLFQLDTEYRKKWDSLVIKLEVIERDQDTGSEVVHWVTHFPVSPAAPGFCTLSSVWRVDVAG